MLNEKKNTFIIRLSFNSKMVKILKTDNLCFFLMKYIQGGNLEDYIKEKKYIKI